MHRTVTGTSPSPNYAQEPWQEHDEGRTKCTGLWWEDHGHAQNTRGSRVSLRRKHSEGSCPSKQQDFQPTSIMECAGLWQERHSSSSQTPPPMGWIRTYIELGLILQQTPENYTCLSAVKSVDFATQLCDPTEYPVNFRRQKYWQQPAPS